MAGLGPTRMAGQGPRCSVGCESCVLRLYEHPSLSEHDRDITGEICPIDLEPILRKLGQDDGRRVAVQIGAGADHGDTGSNCLIELLEIGVPAVVWPLDDGSREHIRLILEKLGLVWLLRVSPEKDRMSAFGEPEDQGVVVGIGAGPMEAVFGPEYVHVDIAHL